MKKFLIAGLLLFSLTMFSPASFKIEVLRTPVASADTGCTGDLWTSPGFVGQSYGHTVVPCVFSGTVHYTPYYHLFFIHAWNRAYWVPY